MLKVRTTLVNNHLSGDSRFLANMSAVTVEFGYAFQLCYGVV